ncbi:hypothetical protein F5Y07DRAFT_406565 [Xylaria sp. FL0933]|nr:hypothetical protein F5Y07DRAFT_406565 [Xylaria sp. FL0933]
MVTTRSQTRSKAFKWLSLPAEIRLMILEAIVYRKNPGWASLASVCREWQYVLEKVNFRTIKLRASCLDGLEYVISPRKRKLIQHIYFNVELPRYSSRCDSRRLPSVNINPPVNKGIRKLFSILSTWRPANSLTLEINVYSPSDCKHWFKNLYLSSDDVEHDENTMSDVWRTGSQYHDPKHGWRHGRQVRSPPETAMLRLFRPIVLKLDDMLPRVEAVTRLIIRRQLRRCFSPPSLGLLLRSLGRLEHLSYEPWMGYHDAYMANDQYIAEILRFDLHNTLKSLIVFRDSREFYDLFPKGAAHIQQGYGLFAPREALSRTFAAKSLNLQHLAISFMVNAEELFRHCQSTWTWLRLQSLALTSQLLQDDWEKRSRIPDLLYQAGAHVQNMPLLHTFVLWNGGKAHACAFIYRVGRDTASVTWRGSWHLELSPEVLKPWQLAASKLLRSEDAELQIKQEHIAAAINSHGDAIFHLELPCQVVEPASLWQIRREAYSLPES